MTDSRMTSPNDGREGGHRSLRRLAEMVRQKNAADRGVAEIIERPALPGHFGEFVAADIFGIELCRSATQEGYDGWFRGGALDGKTVNIKYYTKHDGLLDLRRENGPDYYLVMTGPTAKPTASRGQARPWVIESVFLFHAARLIEKMTAKIGVAAAVGKSLWKDAEIYPRDSSLLPLEQSQKDLLALFRESAVG